MPSSSRKVRRTYCRPNAFTLGVAQLGLDTWAERDTCLMNWTLEVAVERPFTVQEVAVRLDYHPDRLRRLLRAGRVKGERIGQMRLVPRHEVERIKALQGPCGRLPKESKQKSG